MAGADRVQVKKGHHLIILVDEMGGQFAPRDAAEQAVVGHGASIPAREWANGEWSAIAHPQGQAAAGGRHGLAGFSVMLEEKPHSRKAR